MKTKIILLAIFIVFTSSANSQNSYIKNRWNIKLAYQNEKTGLSSNIDNIINAKGFNLAINYGVLNNFEFGVNFGYLANLHYDYNTIHYYINSNYHILPYFIKTEDFRLDAYLTADLGGKFVEYTVRKYQRMIYGVGIGFAFYPLKHFGIFGEYKLGKYHVSNSKYNIGLSIKF
ncbi:MAG: hypothetical protein GX879_01620 [Bacteroidales bacterium]|nr:hypothetical protein [Bacteroidales bacterium]